MERTARTPAETLTYLIRLDTSETLDLVAALRQTGTNLPLAERIKTAAITQTYQIRLNAGESLDLVAALRQTGANPTLAERIKTASAYSLTARVGSIKRTALDKGQEVV